MVPPINLSKKTSYSPVKASVALVQLTVTDDRSAPSLFKSAASLVVTLVGAEVNLGLGSDVLGAMSMPKVSPKFQS